MQLTTVKIEKPDDINFILGQSHFVKTVEDIHESMVQTVPGIKFGLAFCESSGEMLVRWTGTDDSTIELAKRNALASQPVTVSFSSSRGVKQWGHILDYEVGSSPSSRNCGCHVTNNQFPCFSYNCSLAPAASL